MSTTNAKHTPGPWEVCGPSWEKRPSVRSAHGPLICCTEHGPDDGWANAELIAQAPTMAARIAELERDLAAVTAQRDQCREALRDYMGNNGSGPKSCGHMAHCVCPYDKARAALRACEGGRS